MNKVVSGITPSGKGLHIGNYFGAVEPQVSLVSKVDEAFYFVADLHALTTIRDPKVLEENIINVVLDYLALGLDPQKVTFFRQSDVKEHSELAVILANFVSMGQMKRMHAYKDKLAKGVENEDVNMGLFNYPILMAADILLYKPSGVPVGEDQRQHVELTRDIALNFNRAVSKETLILPEPLIGKETGRIIGTDGQRKMGKSLGNTVTIFDDEETIRKQIFSVYTDPARVRATDPGKIEGNMAFAYHDLINDNKDEVEDLKSRYRAGNVGDVEVKQKLFEAHLRKFASAREKRKELEANIEMVREILASGAKKASMVASQTLTEVKTALGIINTLNK
jgi:tryptophanyl-tRNA synthetase